MTVLRETILLSAVSKTIAIKGPSWKRQFVRNQKQQTLKEITENDSQLETKNNRL